MKSFLKSVAQDLYTKMGGDLSHTAVVFPNKRARLFFNEHLAAESEGPMWSPTYISIAELFQQMSALKVGDPIKLVAELYKIFIQKTGSQETLDDFYFWGELLISDFDDLDKNLVNADQLFSNLSDLRKMSEGAEFLDEDQVAAIRQFFHNFSPDKRTELKERFLSLWEKLNPIYHQYRQRLHELGLAYEGMMYREVLQQIDTEQLPYEKYVFIGFNVLNKVETELFLKLKDAGKALFYWDYDVFYTYPANKSSHEAGEFIRRNLEKFPNELPADFFDNMKQAKRVEYISAPTENAQARYLTQWLQYNADGARTDKNTAVVLCNEALLLPVLHSLPEEIRHINITMGFPLTQTPVYSLINAWVEVQTKGYMPSRGCYRYENVISLLKHPYTRRLSLHAERIERQLRKNNRFYPLPSELCVDEVLTLLFTPVEGNLMFLRRLTEVIQAVVKLYRIEKAENDEETNTDSLPAENVFDQLYREALFKSYTLVNRLASLVESGDLEGVKSDTVRRLLGRLLSAASIPFHGEPAIGLQIMGVLETRNLDFDHLIMLSLNEGQLPKAEGDSSFIPYNLRKAWGMTTIEHKNAVYAYYFYRLIQRACNITLLYNTSSDGLNRGEMSRFMLQYLVESPHDIAKYYLEAGQTPRRTTAICIEKNPELLQMLRCQYDTRLHPDSYLSPSALNAYLDCPLMFYYRYLLHLKSTNDVSEEIDNALFGTIFHRSAELAYKDLTVHGPQINREDIEQLLKHPTRLQSYVNRAFNEEFFHTSPDARPAYNGTQLINSKVIVSYLKQLLRLDMSYAPFSMVGMEEHVSESLWIETEEGEIPIMIGGTVDRMDKREETLRIVDYKTGGSPKMPESIEQLFTPANGRPSYVFQIFLYAAILSRKQPLLVAPALLYIHQAASESYSPVIQMGPMRQPKIPVTNFSFFEEEFHERLKTLLKELFSADTPFTQTAHEQRCEYCDFRKLCRR
ncbi:MAG: PD-(D/E)XK nuclease family protein [Bacteroides sp.]|nr:PD-(D/E)XK nuclease family protein [Bacteroides sp.]